MSPTTKKLLLGSMVLAGALTFTVLPAASGPFDGSGQSGVSGAPRVSTGGKVYLDHPTDSVYLQYDGGSIGLVGAEVDAPNGFTDSQKVNPDTIITPYAVVPQAASGQAAFRVAQTGARVYFDVGGNIYAYSDGSQVVAASAWDIPSLSTDTIGTHTAARNKVEIFYPQPYPLGSLASCSSGFKGRLETLSTDGRSYACDGTTTQRLAYSLSATATIDFASMNSQATDSKTMTVAGALTSDAVVCTPVNGGTMSGTDMHPTVTSADTVTIVAHNDTNGTVDPPSMDIKCVIIR